MNKTIELELEDLICENQSEQFDLDSENFATNIFYKRSQNTIELSRDDLEEQEEITGVYTQEQLNQVEREYRESDEFKRKCLEEALNVTDAENIGEGSYGSVYLANKGNEKIVIKRNNDPKPTYRLETLLDLENEYKFLKKTNHQNIIKAKRIVKDNLKDNVGYLELEYVEGKTLCAKLNEDDNISQKEFVDILYQIVDGLKYLDSKKIVHNDIKPENIMVDENNNVKIIDFGTAEKIGLLKKEMLNERQIKGTPRYLPVEKLIGNYETNSDLYPLGVMIAESILNYEFEIPDMDQVPKLTIQGVIGLTKEYYLSQKSDLYRNIMIGRMNPEKNNHFEEETAELVAGLTDRKDKRMNFEEIYKKLDNLKTVATNEEVRKIVRIKNKQNEKSYQNLFVQKVDAIEYFMGNDNYTV